MRSVQALWRRLDDDHALALDDARDGGVLAIAVAHVEEVQAGVDDARSVLVYEGKGLRVGDVEVHAANGARGDGDALELDERAQRQRVRAGDASDDGGGRAVEDGEHLVAVRARRV